ncbi:MAG TPA: porin family protein [Flavobacteriales bacterium]|nr:PorT family protein [Flavobacteriales bacterium]HOP43681.1 porin family protein [Flavobacteriales bacterium]
MKPVLTSLLALCLTGTSVLAQDDSGTATPPAPARSSSSDDGVRLGLKVAPNFHWLRPDTKGLESDGNNTGLSFGIVVDFPFGDNGQYAFHTGALLNYIGGPLKADYSTDTSTVVSTQDTKLRYVEIPLCLKLRTRMDQPLNFYGQLGVSAAINVRARSDFETTTTILGNNVTASDTDVDIIDDVQAFKLALVAGAGVELTLDSGPTLFGGIVYNNGLMNVLQGDAKYIVNEDKKSKLFADYLEISLGVYL